MNSNIDAEYKFDGHIPAWSKAPLLLVDHELTREPEVLEQNGS